MEYLRRETTVRERRAVNKPLRSLVPLTDEELTYEGPLDAQVRLDRLRTQAQAGYFVIPEHAIFRKDLPYADNPFGFKQGPFYDISVDRDMRVVQRTLLQGHFPTVARFNNEIIPSQLVGIRFGIVGQNRYAVNLTDIISAQIAYESIRRTGRIVDSHKGYVRVRYDHGIQLTMQGLRKDTPTEINAQVENIPSREDLDRGDDTIKGHQPHYDLETFTWQSYPKGYFKAVSALRPWRVTNRVTYKIWPVADEKGAHPIIRDDPTTSKGPSMRREALYFPDILGMLLSQGVAKRQYQVYLNQPFPAFPQKTVSFAQRLFQQALIVDEGRGRRPSVAESEQLFLALADLWRTP